MSNKTHISYNKLVCHHCDGVNWDNNIELTLTFYHLKNITCKYCGKEYFVEANIQYQVNYQDDEPTIDSERFIQDIFRRGTEDMQPAPAEAHSQLTNKPWDFK